MESHIVTHKPSHSQSKLIRLQVREDGYLNASQICKENNLQPWAHLARGKNYEKFVHDLQEQHPGLNLVDVQPRCTWIHPIVLDFFSTHLTSQYVMEVHETLSACCASALQSLAAAKVENEALRVKVANGNNGVADASISKLEEENVKLQKNIDELQESEKNARTSLQQLQEESKLQIQRLEDEAKVKIDQSEREGKSKIEQLEEEIKCKVEQLEVENNSLRQKVARLQKNYDNACERYNHEIGMQSRWTEWTRDWMTVYEYVLKTYKLQMSEQTFKRVEKAVGKKFIEKYSPDIPQHWKQINKYHELVSVVHPLNPNIEKPPLPRPPEHFKKNTPTNIRVYNRRDWHLIDDQIELFRDAPYA